MEELARVKELKHEHLLQIARVWMFYDKLPKKARVLADRVIPALLARDPSETTEEKSD